MSVATLDGITRTTTTAAPPPSPTAATADMIARATDTTTGRVDTAQLGRLVANAARTDPQAASAAYEAIEARLGAGDAGRFNADVAKSFRANQDQQPGGPTYSATGLAQGVKTAGSQVLQRNPILEIQWRTTVSPVTGRSGFSQPLQKLMTDAGIKFDYRVNLRPPGSTAINTPATRTQNGHAARDQIAARLETDPAYGNVRNERDGRIVRQTSLGERHVDVTATRQGTRPENNVRVDVESKLGYSAKSLGPKGNAAQVAKDAERLAENANIRRLGTAVEHVGRVARPIGLVVDAVQIGSAFRADGNKFGDKTQHAAGSLVGGAAGAWGGAQAGAALGSLAGPVGTVVGGIGGAVVGGIVGSGVGEKAVDWVKSWL